MSAAIRPPQRLPEPEIVRSLDNFPACILAVAFCCRQRPAMSLLQRVQVERAVSTIADCSPPVQHLHRAIAPIVETVHSVMIAQSLSRAHRMHPPTHHRDHPHQYGYPTSVLAR